MSTERITSSEYYAECEQIALTALQSNYSLEDGSIDDDNSMDYIHECIDSHQYVIYTYKAKTILDISANELAWMEYHGTLQDLVQGLDSMNDVYTRMAQCCMEADVMERFNALKDELAVLYEDYAMARNNHLTYKEVYDDAVSYLSIAKADYAVYASLKEQVRKAERDMLEAETDMLTAKLAIDTFLFPKKE